MISTQVSTSANPTQPASAAQPVQAAQAVPAATGATSSKSSAAGATGSTPAATSAATTSAAAPATQFAQWLGQQADSAAAVVEGALPPVLSAALSAGIAMLPASASADASAPASTSISASGTDDGKQAADDAAAAVQDTPLLAAMAMPLMPLTPMQIAQAVQSAQGNSTGAGDARANSQDDAAARAKPAAGQSAAVGVSVTTGAQDGGRRADIALAQLPVLASQAARPDDPSVRFAIQAAGSAQANGNAGGTSADAGQDSAAALPNTAMPAAGAALAGTPAAAQPAPDTVKLAGPPTAWRQSLQEALGERLNLQVGKNMEQATIRLEPPQLGRIDIAIRHSNGTLEVNISASNGDVLRQLQTVSDNLRSDLAQRQYTDVAVSVTPTPKNNGASPFSDPQQQQQGRGRGQGRDQDEPGSALAEAGNPSSVFSLGGRDA
jgi:flagellar hook-length control protein FliK